MSTMAVSSDVQPPVHHPPSTGVLPDSAANNGYECKPGVLPTSFKTLELFVEGIWAFLIAPILGLSACVIVYVTIRIIKAEQSGEIPRSIITVSMPISPYSPFCVKRRVKFKLELGPCQGK